MKKVKVPTYNFKAIEKKWQRYWEVNKTNQADIDRAKKPFYNLMMFPYPSAEGLHVGSVYTFSGVDTYGRFKKLQGYDVFEPIGLDGFGIHSENYAMKIGEHILDVSKRTEKNFYRQLHSIGNMFDWSRTVETYKPEYYKWTQWLFLKMYERGLAYRKEAKVNWCPSCKTVLSDEQVIGGRCERCDSEVQKKELAQWFFKITGYAERLLNNLDWIDWPEDVKTNQRNWIGKSEGARIKFKISKGALKTQPEVEVFTTRPDTLFGATYLVVAPEHELISKIKNQILNIKQVEQYIHQAIKKSEQDRKDDTKEKTGIQLEGITAINPATKEKIPVWVSDYVLAQYGTGAIMAVPGHDDRDFEFAKKFKLPIKAVVVPFHRETEGLDAVVAKKPFVKRDVVISIVKHHKEDKYLLIRWKGKGSGWVSFPVGGIKKAEEVVQAAEREAIEETGYQNLQLKRYVFGPIHSQFYARHREINRDGYFHVVSFELKNDVQRKLEKEEADKHELFWVPKEKVGKQINVWTHQVAWERFCSPNSECFPGEGESVNSGFLTGLKTSEAKKEIVKWLEKNKVGKRAVDYKLRDWCISRQRYWGPPIPVVWCKHCALVQKKVKVLMIHGFEGSGNGNWFPWMKKELEKMGCEVFTPTMRTSKHPQIESWMKELIPYLDKLDEDSIIIGHSLGSKAALHLLERTSKKIGKLFLVASAIGNPRRDWDWLKNEWKGSDVDALKTFWKQKVDWQDVDYKVKEKYIIVSKDDRFIDDRHSKVAELNNLVTEIWDKQGHFTQAKNHKLKDYFIEKIWKDVNPIAVPVPEKDLPVKLPLMEDFLPEGKGKGPLAKNEKFVKTLCPVCGGPAERETDVSDPFVDSAWYFFRYPSTDCANNAFDKKRTEKWLPVDSYIGGKEHTVLHLLYSRFVTMVLKDLGYISFEEPYKRFYGHGLITKDGAKMSKSKGNVVNPDEMINRYGVDTVRMYLRFLGDFSQGGDWRDSGADGMFRFVRKLWNTFFELEGGGAGVKKTQMIDKTIKAVGEDIDKLSFNTAVARIMEFVNWIRENKDAFDAKQSRKIKETLAFLLSPMAPHLAEEFWIRLGNKGSIFTHLWPKYDERNIVDDEIELVVQVNGKVRDKIKVSRNITETEAREKAVASDKIKAHLDGKKIRKLIYVPGRLVSIVV